MERVSAVLAEARAAGLEVRTEGERLVVRGPRTLEPLAQQLLAHKPVVMALLVEDASELGWRVAAMRAQVPRKGPIPFLVAREVERAPGRCLSCGEALEVRQRYRCRACVRATQVVLGWVREGIVE